MPTNTNAYNSRVTDEALEKRFRDTFRSQGGAELVDDLYAQGVIVPVVDFTAAATGQQLGQNLQTAVDFSTSLVSKNSAGTSTLTTSPGFWRFYGQASIDYFGNPAEEVRIRLTDGFSTKIIWNLRGIVVTGSNSAVSSSFDLVVFLRSGDSASVQVNNGGAIDLAYRQIATVNGDLVNPQGFTSS